MVAHACQLWQTGGFVRLLTAVTFRSVILAMKHVLLLLTSVASSLWVGVYFVGV